MKKLIMFLTILLSVSLIWAADTPFRAKAVSPDKKWLAKLECIDLHGDKTHDWRLCLTTIKTKDKTVLTHFTSLDTHEEVDGGYPWGIYDFCWSPDSRYILFVFRPYTSNSIGHSNDCFGVIDIITKQYEWLAGPVVDKMQSDLFGYSRPDFKLKWQTKNSISFYMSQTSLAKLVGDRYKKVKTIPAGTRNVSLTKIRQVFSQQEQGARTLVKKLSTIMTSDDWRTRVRPLIVSDTRGTESIIGALSENRNGLIRATSIVFVDYSTKQKILAVAVPVTPDQAMPLIIKNNKIIQIPMDLD